MQMNGAIFENRVIYSDTAATNLSHVPYVVTDVQISFIKGTQQQHNISLHDFKRAAYSHKRVKMLVWL